MNVQWGNPGGYIQEWPPEEGWRPQASMTSAAGALTPGHAPPQWVPLPNAVPPTGVVTAAPPPPLVTASVPPPTIVKVPETVEPQIVATPSLIPAPGVSPGVARGMSGWGYTSAWGAPAPSYGKLFGKDAQAQCAKFRARLKDAQKGRGLFGGGGLFGNRKSVLQGKVEKWCGRAKSEKEAFQMADDLYLDALSAGDAAAAGAVELALEEQIAADRQTQIFAAAGVGVAALGLIGYMLLSGGKKGRLG